MGYGQIGVGGNHGRRLLAHRVAWILTFGPIPDGLWVLHSCDNPPCVRPDHLFLGTALANSEDRDAKGRGAKGERNGMFGRVVAYGEGHPMARLTADQVREIRRRYRHGSTQTQLALEFSVHQTHISDIVRRVVWRSI
jgi:hypothetical protein